MLASLGRSQKACDWFEVSDWSGWPSMYLATATVRSGITLS